MSPISRFGGVWYDLPMEKAKQDAGAFAAIVWVASGLFFCFSTHVSFMSWVIVAYFLAGMLAAAIIFGNLVYLIDLSAAKLFAGYVPITPRAAIAARLLSWLLFAAEAWVIFLAAGWVFDRIRPA